MLIRVEARADSPGYVLRENRFVDRGLRIFIGRVTIMFGVVGVELLKVLFDLCMRGWNWLFLRVMILFFHGIH